MISFILPAIAIAAIIAIPFAIVAIARRSVTRGLVVGYMATAYFCALVYLTLVIPFGYAQRNINLLPYIPFIEPPNREYAEMLSWFDIREYLYNILLYVPFGVIFPLLAARRGGFLMTLLVGLCCTFAIELAQYFIGRAFDINDVIANALGVATGYVLLGTARALLQMIAEKRRSTAQ